MKSRLITAVLAMGLIAGLHTHALAQQPKNVLKLNPLSLGLLTANVQYERALTPGISAQLGAFISGFRFSSGDERTVYQGYGVTPEIRFYVSQKRNSAPEGMYVAPFARFQQFDVEVTSEDVVQTSDFFILGGGAILGYQFIFDDVFVLDLFAGPSMNFVDAMGTVNEEDIPGISGSMLGFRSGVSIGVAF